MANAGEIHQALRPNIANQETRIPPYVIFTCVMVGSGGLMYGYDLVIAGGISIMDDFLQEFYPSVFIDKNNAKQDNYCKYNNQVFQLFSSSLYLAALLATFFASKISRKFGRKGTMLCAGIFFIVGTLLGTLAQNLGMLISGRALLGCGIGLANQAVPVYLSEIAPPSFRGGLNLFFAVYVSVGILSGNIVNYIAANIHPWGWRLSLGLAGVPALLLTMCSLMVVETPSSLIERGHHEEAKTVLRRVRGSMEVEREFEELLDIAIQVSEERSLRFNPYKELFCERRNRAQVVLACALPFFQQMSGIDAILFYGPFLFKVAGFGDNASLYSAIITGATSFLSTCIAAFVVDKLGRRRLLMIGSVFMVPPLPRRGLIRGKHGFKSQGGYEACFSSLPHFLKVVITCIFGTKLQGNVNKLPTSEAIVEVVMVCLFMIAFSLSLGPLAWLIPSEIFSQDVRSAGQSVTVFVSMLFKFVITQTFLSMLCAFKFGIFLFFAGWVMVMGIFTLLFLPETKYVPLDNMTHLWQNHWFWHNIVLP